MIKNLNLDWFKNNLLKNKKIKVIAASLAVAIGLAGCGITSSKTSNHHHSEPTPTSSVVAYVDDTEVDYKVEFNYSNWDTEIQKQEVISISDSKGTVYRSLGIKDDGTTSTNIHDNSGKIHSYVLHKSVDIPKTDENHKIVVDIDYSTQAINTEVVSLEKTK